MTTAIDSNVLVALWNEDDNLNTEARRALDTALSRGSLVVAAPVFAELLAASGRTEEFLNVFCEETGIAIEWDLRESVWRAAGRAYQSHVSRRKRQGAGGPRRILADFLIGAHAAQNGYRLLTLDDRLYRAAFPGLVITRL